jgi:2-oxoisovalerate dehydrogenase E1 component
MSKNNFYSKLDKSDAKKYFEHLFLPRAVEDRMLLALRQGIISKWFSSYGQEAVSVATTLAMHEDEWICTMHRNLGVFTSRNIPLEKLFSQFQGKPNGFTKGRDRSFHFGSKEHNIFGMISHLGAQLGVADGLAFARKLNHEKKCVLVFTGDGGASQGDFHEALNVASVWKLPVLFVVENNQWGLSTPSNEQFNFDSFTVKGDAYGMEAHSIDGNDFAATLSISKKLTSSIRSNPRPILLECKTFRVRGHEEASGTKYYPKGLIDSWKSKDPILNFRENLISKKILSKNEIESIEESLNNKVLGSLKIALKESDSEFKLENELKDVFSNKKYDLEKTQNKGELKKMRFIDAIHSGLECSLKEHDNLIFMGQDIADYGGVFKATDTFLEKFGKERIINTPLCESAIVGVGVGLSVMGKKTMIEMQFSDFVSEAMTQICNQAAKLNYRWGQNVDMVIRMPTGAGVNAGPFHSQSTESWFTRIPGLKVVYPSNAFDAKGLLIQAFEDPNPILFFEHKALYRSQESDVNEGYYTLPIGKAATINEGDQITIISYGLGIKWVQDWLNENKEVSCDLIDLRSLVPLDIDTLVASVKKTGRCVIVQEDTIRGSIGSDISQIIQSECFEYLDSPIKVISSIPTPIPFASNLEKGYLANNWMDQGIKEVIRF